MILWSFLMRAATALGLSDVTSKVDAEKWLVLRAITDGQTRILSVRPSVPSKATRLRFPFEATLVRSYEQNETGLPAAEAELHAMYDLEESLRNRDPDAKVFLQAIRETGEGTRTWTFYVHDKSAFQDLLAEERDAPSPSFRHDPKWSSLRAILAGVRP
jgi:hypothetical protein